MQRHRGCQAAVLPDTTDGAEFAHGSRVTKDDAVHQPQRMRGSVTRKNVNQPPAPSVIAASSSSAELLHGGMKLARDVWKSDEHGGQHDAGQRVHALISCSCSQAPNQPLRPNNST